MRMEAIQIFLVREALLQLFGPISHWWTVLVKVLDYRKLRPRKLPYTYILGLKYAISDREGQSKKKVSRIEKKTSSLT